MADKTGIEWTDATWNPLRGCSKVDLDCRNCYAETMAARFAGPGQPYEGTISGKRWNGQIRLVPEHLADPLRWQRPRRVFVNSMSDLFHESVPFEYVAAVFGVMGGARNHTFQVLTKRPGRAVEFFSWLQERHVDEASTPWLQCAAAALGVLRSPDAGKPVSLRDTCLLDPTAPWPLPNVWIGTSVGYGPAEPRIDELRAVPAAVRFLSLEPLHGPLSPDLNLSGIGWVIVGGESGPGARPMHPEWAMSVRDQCVAAGVPFFFKQWGEWVDVGPAYGAGELSANERVVDRLGGQDPGGDGARVMRNIGKKNADRLLEGREWNEMPFVYRGSQ